MDLRRRIVHVIQLEDWFVRHRRLMVHTLRFAQIAGELADLHRRNTRRRLYIYIYVADSAPFALIAVRDVSFLYEFANGES